MRRFTAVTAAVALFAGLSAAQLSKEEKLGQFEPAEVVSVINTYYPPLSDCFRDGCPAGDNRGIR